MHRRLGLWIIVLLLGLSGRASEHALAGNIACGAILGPGGKFVLDSNVGPCPGPEPAITVNSARLDLNGFSVSCGADPAAGIVIVGTEAKVHNGTVTGCVSGVELRGQGSHKLWDILAVALIDGLVVSSDQNILSDNTVSVSGRAGILVTGNYNTLTENIAASLLTGILVAGSYNRLTENAGMGGLIAGILLGGTNNRAEGNVADGVEAFLLSGSNHQVKGNTAFAGFSVRFASNLRLTDNTAICTDGFCLVLPGFHIVERSMNITLIGNTVSGFRDGFVINNASHNFLKNNTATGVRVGFSLASGSHNTLANNTATDNSGTGFVLDDATNSLLEANVARNNGQNGVHLFIGASNNRVVKTKASGNGSFDLQDDNVNCGTNLWEQNTGTKSQGCIQ